MASIIVGILHNCSVPLFRLTTHDLLNIDSELFVRRITPALREILVIKPEFDNARVEISRVPKTQHVLQGLNVQ
eukprot:4219416-Heterocapsa_arctica.AAC.1